MKDCFIRKNTPELRDKLQELGYYICHCTVVYRDAVWLVTCNKTGKPSVHGIGYGDKNIQSALDFFLYENEKSENPLIDCGEDEEMFLKIAKENLL